MDKSLKLQRYGRKDYTETVEFPVEIVGRDGVVRRYSFEDSIRLYQRRITFAPIRYRDAELIAAEVSHCRFRIDQLRRSYFHRYGWGTAEGDPKPDEVFGELAGELAAFVCRVLRSEGRPEVRLVEVERSPTRSLWYLVPEGYDTGMLLYVHRFEGDDAEQTREQFFGELKRLEQATRGFGGEADDNVDDGERLIAFHHTADCGFVLSGRGTEFDAFAALHDDDVALPDIAPTPWDHVVDAVRRGQLGRALERCRLLTREQPYHLQAYAAGAMLATALRRPVVAEDLAHIGSMYFPSDPLLQYYLGASRLDQERYEEGEAALRRALELSPGLVAARFRLVLHLLDQQRYVAASRALRTLVDDEGEDRRGVRLLRGLRQWLRWRQLMVGPGLAVIVMGVGVSTALGPPGAVVAILGATMTWTGSLVFRSQLERIVERARFDEVSSGLRRMHRWYRNEETRVS